MVVLSGKWKIVRDVLQQMCLKMTIMTPNQHTSQDFRYHMLTDICFRCTFLKALLDRSELVNYGFLNVVSANNVAV